MHRNVARRSRSLRLDHASAGGRGANNFDLLRLAAALFVVLAHSFDLLRIPEPFPNLRGMSWGFVGILIFFSISGFLVARSWTSNPRLLPFVVKRALRLMPALIVALLAAAFVLGPLVTTEPLRAYLYDPATKAYVLNNTLLQSDYYLPGVFVHNAFPLAVNGSLWTLPVEVKAYAFVALAGILGLLTRWKGVMVAIAVLLALACIDGLRSSLPGANHFVAALVDIQARPSFVYEASRGLWTIYVELFTAFAIGATLYALRRWVALRWDFAALCVCAWLGTVLIGGSAPEKGATFLGPYVLLCLAYLTTKFVRLPRRFGDYSYGTYVYAFPVQQTISLLLAPTNGWLVFMLATPVTLALAVVSWHFVERPALNLKQRIAGAEPPAGDPQLEHHVVGA